MSFSITYNIEAIDKFSRVSRKIGREVTALSQKINRFNANFKRVGETMGKFGRNLSLKAGVPLTLFGTLAIRTALAFQKAMNMVAADTDSTAAQFKQLHDAAIHMGATTQFTATQVANAEMFLGRAGQKTHGILALLPHVLQLASSAQLDMGAAANIAVHVMSAYNMKAKDMGEVNNVLVKAFTSTNVNLEMLGESFKMAGTILKTSGVSFKDAAAMFGILGNTGMQATRAGTSLRKVMAAIVHPSASFAKGLKKVGLSLHYVSGKLKSPIVIIEQLKKAGLTTAGALEFMGLRGGPALESLVMHVNALIKLRKTLEHTGNIAERIGKAQMRGLVGSTLRLKSAFDVLQIKLVEAVQPSLMSIMGGLTKFLAHINDSSDGVRHWIGVIMGAVIAAGPLLMTLGKLLIVMSLLGIKIPLVAVANEALATSFGFLWRSVLGPVGVLISLGMALAWAYNKFKLVRTIIDSITIALTDEFVVPIQFAVREFMKFADAIEWVWNKLHHKTVQVKAEMVANTSAAHTGSAAAPMQKVHSTLDVNLNDPGGFIKTAFGHTGGDKMSVNVGTNMVLARS